MSKPATTVCNGARDKFVTSSVARATASVIWQVWSAPAIQHDIDGPLARCGPVSGRFESAFTQLVPLAQEEPR